MTVISAAVSAACGLALLVTPSVQAATYGPTITWVSPQAQSTVSGTMTAKVSVTPGAFQVSSVSLSVSSDTAYWDLTTVNQGSGVWAASWNTKGLNADGLVDITAEAIDTNGVTSTTTTQVWVNNCASTATLYAPTGGEVLAGTATVAAVISVPCPAPFETPSDEGFDVYVDGSRVGRGTSLRVDGTYGFRLNTRGLSNGAHTLAIGAFDGSHDPISASVDISIHNPVTSALTLTSQRSVTYGKAVALKASLSDPQTPGSGIAGRTVYFYYRKVMSDTYRLIGQARTDLSGVAHLNFKAPRNGEYQAKFVADADWLSSRSKTRSVGVRPVVTARLSDSTPAVGQRYRIYGQVAPRLPGDSIVIEYYHAGRWRSLVGYLELSRRSTYAWTFTPSGVGTARLRAVYVGNVTFNDSPSRAVTVTSH